MDIKKITVIILAALLLGVGGYFILRNFLSPMPPQPSPSPSATPEEKKISAEDERDNQRINDIMTISKALESYAKDHNGQYPIAEEQERISDESSVSFQILESGNYLDRVLKDPLPDRYYYGYRSDGQAYELTTVLENKDSGKCIQAGNYCVYKFSKGEIGATPTPEYEPIGK